MTLLSLFVIVCVTLILKSFQKVPLMTDSAAEFHSAAVDHIKTISSWFTWRCIAALLNSFSVLHARASHSTNEAKIHHAYLMSSSLCPFSPLLTFLHSHVSLSIPHIHLHIATTVQNMLYVHVCAWMIADAERKKGNLCVLRVCMHIFSRLSDRMTQKQVHQCTPESKLYPV